MIERPDLDVIEQSAYSTRCQWGCDDTILQLAAYARALEAEIEALKTRATE